GVQLDATHRVAEELRIAGAFLVGRDGADERFGLRGEDLRRGAEDLGGSFAHEHVLVLDLEMGGDRLGELTGLVRIAARLPAVLRHRLRRAEHFLTRSDRVLVARDADHAALDGLEVGLDCRPDAVLTTAAPDAAGKRGARPKPGGLDELTS